MSFYSNDHSSSGSAHAGPLMMIVNRWLESFNPNRYIVTVYWKDWGHNIAACVDDFGDLVPLETGYGQWRFHQTQTGE